MVSGTHEREQQLWLLAGARPAAGHLIVAGSGMGTTVRIASESEAYTLTDRATLSMFAGALRLVIAFEGGPLLLNTYAVTMDPSGTRAKDALAFYEWLTEGGGRTQIEQYQIGATRAFSVWPKGVPGDHPEAQLLK
jgi:tungstate transport system substrate-binding protein